MENIYEFKSHYEVYNPPIKTIELLYICKSKIENYSLNKRTIINRDEIHDILKKHGAIFLETDNLKSIKEQVDIVRKTKIIVYEFGSALINTSLFANSLHSLVLNKFTLGQGHLDILKILLEDSKCSWEFFENKLPNYDIVNIDTISLDKRITELLVGSSTLS
jgi:capsular polysaccharide biosynthesis protein